MHTWTMSPSVGPSLSLRRQDILDLSSHEPFDESKGSDGQEMELRKKGEGRLMSVTDSE